MTVTVKSQFSVVKFVDQKSLKDPAQYLGISLGCQVAPGNRKNLDQECLCGRTSAKKVFFFFSKNNGVKRLHMLRLTSELYKTLTVMDWSPQSPALNIIQKDVPKLQYVILEINCQIKSNADLTLTSLQPPWDIILDLQTAAKPDFETTAVWRWMRNVFLVGILFFH